MQNFLAFFCLQEEKNKARKSFFFSWHSLAYFNFISVIDFSYNCFCLLRNKKVPFHDTPFSDKDKTRKLQLIFVLIILIFV